MKTEPIAPISVNFPRAAELTSISVGHLRRMAANGTLRTVLVGRRRLIPIQALVELVQVRTIVARQ